MKRTRGQEERKIIRSRRRGMREEREGGSDKGEGEKEEKVYEE